MESRSVRIHPLLVVCALLSWQPPTVSTDECGTKFTDPMSRAVLAQVVFQGTVREMNSPAHYRSSARTANITVGKVYKGMDILKGVGMADGGTVVVSQFGLEDRDKCIAPETAMHTRAKQIYFLQPSRERHVLQLSAMPLPMEADIEAKVMESLCDSCVKPPVIRGITCQNCIQHPQVKDIETEKVRIGQSTKLRCVAEGNPIPTITWLKDGLPVTSGSGGITVIDRTLASTIRIRQTTSAHFGQYVCIASNILGKSMKEVTLEFDRERRTTTSRPTRSSTTGQCQGKHCLNGGRCEVTNVQGVSTPVCRCRRLYEGPRCEIKTVATDKSQRTDRADQSQRRRTVGADPSQSRSRRTHVGVPSKQ
ncbi:unnamed protein product [Lymnaea stagnalis]|uniref:Uncharacterized protein n=1 Tax=Lymnaea stagnalis TaxID=6523 RepID=A0AAV2GXV7_LYMST